MQSLPIHNSIIWTALDTKSVFAMRKKYFLSNEKILTSILIKHLILVFQQLKILNFTLVCAQIFRTLQQNYFTRIPNLAATTTAEWYISGNYSKFAAGEVWMECCYVTKLQKVSLKYWWMSEVHKQGVFFCHKCNTY